MMKFLKSIFSSAIGTIIGLSLFFGMIFLFFVGLISLAESGSKGGDKVKIKENTILKLSLNKTISERSSKDNPFEELDLPFGGQEGKIGLIELVNTIENAKNDANIKGIYLDLPSISSGTASLEVIRRALLDFKTSGKFIVAYAEVMTEGAYYLASVSDEIYIYPEGMLEFNGLSTEIMFFTGLFEKLGIEAKIFKVGKFKSAVEPFFRKDMSEANRMQVTSFLNSIYDHYLEEVSKSRGIEIKQLELISDSMLVRTAADAVKYGLITKTAYPDEVEQVLKQKTGIDAEEELNFVEFNKYSKSNNNSAKSSSENKIAVIIASGEIVSGKSENGSMGSTTIANAIREARLDKNVKAIVLRVNSPGGSALASDVMWREVMLTKQVKPIVASMSDVAASGGYYISMACDRILAEPNTITGSIGVFGMMFNLQNFMEDKIGLTFDGVKTGEFSDLPNLNRPMTEFEAQVIQESVNDIYEDFTQKAADGRKMDVEKLREVASGRVWTGLEAIEIGLVDEIGGLKEAISIAANNAKLDSNYSVEYLPKEKEFMEKLLEDLGVEAQAMFYPEELVTLKPYLNDLKKLENMKGVQARMPFDFRIIQ